MKSVYISSTRKDLKEYIEAVTDTLRQCGYDVEAMEKYPARDDRPRAASEADVEKCDTYVGIFAWTYGFVPTEDNPQASSITELEYLAAGRAQKPRLVFLLDEDFPWPSSLRDAEQQPDAGKRIRDLRNRLKAERWISFFKSPDDLAKRVLTSIIQLESTHRVNSLAGIDEVQSAAEMGASYFPNLQQKFAEFGANQFVALRLGPTPWWNTRFHLVSSLASDFTEIKQFIILDTDRKVLVVAAPVEIRRALTKSQPKLEIAYLQCRNQPPTAFPASEVDRIIAAYPAQVANVFGNQQESIIKEVVTPATLRELGIKPQGEVVEQFSSDRNSFSSADILKRRERYVVLVRDGNVDGIVDRVELASRIATRAL